MIFLYYGCITECACLFGGFNYWRLNCRGDDNQMRFSLMWSLCMQILPLKCFRTAKTVLWRAPQLSSRYRLKMRCQKETLMLIVHRYITHTFVGLRWECAFRALCRQRINSAAGGFSVKPPRPLSSSRAGSAGFC